MGKARERRGLPALEKGLACLAVVVVACVVWLSSAVPAFAATDNAADKVVDGSGPSDCVRILFVGNSFTHSGDLGVDVMLSHLCAANDKPAEIKRVSFGNVSLFDYLTPASADNARFVRLEDRLADGVWDYVVLQDRTRYPMENRVVMHTSIGLIAQRIAQVQPDAKILLYMTHGFDDNSTINGVVRNLSASEMSAYVQSYIEVLGTQFGFEVVPSGRYANTYASRMAPLASDLIADDGKHPSAKGYFLVACACYAAVFGEAPIQADATLDLPAPEEQRGLFTLLERTVSCDPLSAVLLVGQSIRLGYEMEQPAPNEPEDSSLAGERRDDVDGELQDGAEDEKQVEADSNRQDEPDEEQQGEPDEEQQEEGEGQQEEGDGEHQGEVDEEAGPRFTSLDPSIATVDESGLVTAVSAGVTTICVEAPGGDRATCYVSVESSKLFSTGIVFPQESLTVAIGAKRTLAPEVSLALGAYALEWSSSAPDVASVDVIGKVVAKKAGQATIFATDSKSGRSASYTLNVRHETPSAPSAKVVKDSLRGKVVRAVRVVWPAVEGAVRYKVYRSGGGEDQVIVGTTKTASYIDKKVPADVVVKYRIVAAGKGDAIDSKMSAAVHAVVLSKPEASVTFRKNSARISWSRNSKADGYLIYRAKGSKAYKLVKRIKSNSKTAWSDTSANASKAKTAKAVKRILCKNAKRYRYKVQSYCVLDGHTFRGR